MKVPEILFFIVNYFCAILRADCPKKSQIQEFSLEVYQVFLRSVINPAETNF